ncbi:MAG: NAD(P)H-dependent glycerol-3-phosphate dehydrogenase [Pseudomonadales bacterium]|nr:NAD(P)H-dependent glycerol-3-phosphate dehydrogenase [Pseudomonadales bacterium]
MAGQKKVTVLGGGSFGTVLANILATNGHQTCLWMRNPKSAEETQKSRENSKYLPGYHLHENLRICADLSDAVADSELVLFSIPSSSVRSVAKKVAADLNDNVFILSTAKGIEAGSFMLMSQVLAQELPGKRIGALSGPNLAKEIAMGFPAASVVASKDSSFCDFVQDTLGSEIFRIYSAEDIYGIELAGALKNIYAIVTGFSSALGMGHNTNGMLITRSLAEMSRLAVRLGANPLTFLGLAGVGDLIVTCMSDLSRNFQVGYQVGQGKTLEQAVADIGQTAEGVNTLKLVKLKAEELDVYMPLVNGLHKILFEDADVDEVVRGLMLGDKAQDVDFGLVSG